MLIEKKYSLNLLSFSGWERKIEENNIGVFYSPEYSRLDSSWSGGQPECILVEKGQSFLIYPYIKHEILKYSENINHKIYDAQTAYGYGGPLFRGEWSKKEKKESLVLVKEFLKSANIIAEFIRCDPDWFDDVSLRDSGYNLIKVRTNVESDYKNFVYDKCGKRNQNTARKSGLTHKFIVSPSEEEVRQFHGLYHVTANRLKMDAIYRFDLKYFRGLFETLNCASLILVYSPNEKSPIAGSIVFLDNPSSYNFLGASDRKYGRFCPNDYQYIVMAQESKKFGSKKIAWGGGTSNSPEDTLLKFKKHYGDIEVPIYIACRVVEEETYQQVSLNWENQTSPERVEKMKNRFLKYRF